MSTQQACGSSIILFLTSAILYQFFQRRKEKRFETECPIIGIKEEEVRVEDSVLFDMGHSFRNSYTNLMDMAPNPYIHSKPLNDNIGQGNTTTDRPNTISQVDDCHVTTTTSNWGHFECFHRDNGGHTIKSSLNDEISTNPDFASCRRWPSISSITSTWDYAMNLEEMTSISSQSSSNSLTEQEQLHQSLTNGMNADDPNIKKLKEKLDRFAQIMPNKLFLVRHGQSEGNVSEKIYSIKPDNSISLTELGWKQACMAGKALKESIIAPNESIHFIVSPYVRTVETFHGILAAWVDPSEFEHIKDKGERTIAWYKKCYELGITWSEDPRIREQDFGNYQDVAEMKKAKEERHKFGTFYYRFPNGESASDVFDRVSTFLDSLWRSFESKKTKNYVIVTHGVSIRVFLARYFRYTIDQFNYLSNPKNCELIVLKHDGLGKLKFDGRSELDMEDHVDEVTGEKTKRITGYTFHKKMRVVPQQWRRIREVKLSCFDKS